jgi:deoxyribodipyrimidine photo-lyase
MSSPITAERACSRISPYLAFGQISIREVFQAIEKCKKDMVHSDEIFFKSIKSFSSRLRWHCHFIQKLEMQPNLEFTNMVRELCLIKVF